jgi:adenylate kinase family enzyme
MRIAIIGNSGSGKSTLARWLAAQTGAPALDLDTVAWEPGAIAVPRSTSAAEDDVRSFCTTHKYWVVEGCYATLVRIALEFKPRLLFLNPGEQRCLDNCRARPWESHKYPSMAEQDEHLAFLLSWVSQYYTRDGEMSLLGHTACFKGYTGPRDELTRLPRLDPPSAEVAAWINVA